MYTITDNALVYTVAAFTLDPSICVTSYTYVLKDDTGSTVACNCFDTTSLTLTYFHDSDLIPSGPTFRDYTLEVTGASGTNTLVEATASFNLRVKNPCIDPAYVSIQTMALVD